MLSDDTEHTVFVAQSLLAHPGSPEHFARRLARSFRWWLLSLPAGIGFATLRSTLRLWWGIAPARSGVPSAGNGPAMRVAPIGAVFAHSPEKLSSYVIASTRITHTDPRAAVGAMAVARLVAWSIGSCLAARPDLSAFVEELRACGPDDAEWRGIVRQLAEAAERNASVEEFAALLGLEAGVSGYVYHTVPVAAYACVRHFGDFERSLVSVLECGGDTDTTGAIAGALAGSVAGDRGIPEAWIRGIVDWPRGTSLLYRLADRLAQVARDGSPAPVVRYFWPALALRNAVFLLVVLAHGLRRLAPPY